MNVKRSEVKRFEMPVSKSIAIRALALDYLLSCREWIEHSTPPAERPSLHIPAFLDKSNPEVCSDITLFADALSTLCSGRGTIEIGDGATPFRFILALAAATPNSEVSIIPSPQLGQRPHAPLLEALTALGADIYIHTAEDNITITRVDIRGRRLQGAETTLDPSVSSQYASALTLASMLFVSPLTISYEVGTTPVSSSYLEMTKAMLQRTLSGTNPYQMLEYDWSAASYFYEWALLNPGRKIRLPYIPPYGQSLQGDAIIAEIMKTLGVQTTYSDNKEYMEICNTVKDGGDHWKVEIDMGNCPDLVPTLVCGLCGVGRSFILKNVGQLKYKESDRIESLRKELAKLGYIGPEVCKTENHGLCLYYEAKENSIAECRGELQNTDAKTSITKKAATPELDSHNDHRIAMSLAILTGNLRAIRNPDCINKSFPTFRSIFEGTGTPSEFNNTEVAISRWSI
ncbi:MAG: hypothetical protein NC097_08250 [Clostridium sp.]|nr:hypothetical protein [Prevotella sp.]MCM1429766.1 hypothetical protein [Clostridium sp.]MCM1476064.1 hypothetical protein [Muribaculaceae bacterium]